MKERLEELRRFIELLSSRFKQTEELFATKLEVSERELALLRTLVEEGPMITKALGGRFAVATPEAITACAQYCDVLSFNFYVREPQHGYDFAAAAQTCSTVDRRWRAQCFRGLGRDSVDAKYAPETARSRCRATRGGESDCIYGAARTVFDRWGLVGATGVLAFCRDARAAVQGRCYAAIGGVLGLQHASARARRAACARLAGSYSGSCARAAEAEVEPSGVEAWG